ncbi:MAG: NAD(P)/FAD-dependent oxidoreductase [Chitinophagaceae bacterium]|nr:MAG: NAD(P)/FAD-dependent oxidoreductase [Chitinophagaceae bacterium]
MPETFYDVLVIGGSYAGLSAAMALGRSRRRTLVIDSGRPCNRQTPQSHNFLTEDGTAPAAIVARAREAVARYESVRRHAGRAVAAEPIEGGFRVHTDDGSVHEGRKLLFATGVEDLLPPLPGFAACWGISVLHCPYCHGYEVRDAPLGVLANGDLAFEFARLIRHWSADLTLFANGPATLSDAQRERLQQRGVRIDERELAAIRHRSGELEALVFADGAEHALRALFARPAFRQHSDLPARLGCALTEAGHVAVDEFGRTGVPGIFAAGDCTTMFRAVSVAVAAGTKAGAMVNKELIEEAF